MQKWVGHYLTRVQPLAGRPVGRLSGAATRDPSPGADAALDRWVAEAQLAATRAPERGSAGIALSNPGGMRADLPCPPAAAPCLLRFSEAFSAQPVGNGVVVTTLTGA